MNDCTQTKGDFMFTEQMGKHGKMRYPHKSQQENVNGKDDFKYRGNDSVIIFKTVLTINVGRDSAVV